MRAITLLLVALVAGCSSRPATVRPVDIDPSAASAEAMRLYDADKDGFLTDKEMTAVPGVLSAKGFYDTDSDGRVSREEFRQRLAKWNEQAMGFRDLTIQVQLDGQPMSDGEVLLEPEPYLGAAVKPAKGRMRPDGSVSVSVAPEDLPAAIKARGLVVYGVTGGTYKVRITGTKKPLPSKFNDKSEVGLEVATDTVRANAALDLKSK